MANTANDTALTFLDFQKTLDPTGTKLMPVVEVLNQINAPLQDGPITPSNAILGHRVELRASLPTTSIGQINKGVTRSKGTVEQRNESMTMLVNRSVVDTRQKDIWGEAMFNQKRATEDIAAVESMSQYCAGLFLYGNSTSQNSKGFDGLASRMSTLNAPAPGTNGSQVVSMGAVVGGDGASLYVADWNSDRGVHWIYPANSNSGGLQIADKGENVPTNDADSATFFASVTEYTWYIGLAVEDPRRIARIANIDVSDANLGGLATQGLLIDKLVDVLAYMPSPMGFNRVIYAHARLLAAWRKQITGKTAPLFLTLQDYLGEMTPHFDGVPVRRIDQALLSEGTVS